MKHVFIRALKAYQALSRSIPTNPLLFGGISGCRSWPTCSDFALDVVEREGVLKGSIKAIVRVMQCNPLRRSEHHG